MSGRSSREHPHQVFLGLGGNIGEPAKAMRTVLEMLDGRADTQVIAVSSLYRSPPWGKTDQPDFLNAAARLRTELAPRDLLRVCLDIEQALKRVRNQRWGPRSIDVDILLYDDLAIEEEGLVIPHPRMTERAFVLVPLAEIAASQMIGGATVSDLGARLDANEIEMIAPASQWWQAVADG